MIGIVAGVGPYAGLDLLGKILSQTKAQKDQDHLPVFSISQPDQIVDRTAFLLGQAAENPGLAIGEQFLRLEKMGATVGGVPCNTAHAPAIWKEITRTLQEAGSHLQLVNMITETGRALQRQLPGVKKVGVLSTTGTAQAKVYPRLLQSIGFEVVELDGRLQQEWVQAAIYDPAYGIKARGAQASRARSDLISAVATLRETGAEATILGCTEIPLVLPEPAINDMPLLDATLVLARALIRAFAPQKLVTRQ